MNHYGVHSSNFCQPAQCAQSSEGNISGEIRIIWDYPDVFLEELPGMPPNLDIEFIIELLLGTLSISKRPYRMPMNELVELKKQIAEL
jgi:hypothetical protein